MSGVWLRSRWERIMASARFTVTRAQDEEEIPIGASDGGYGALPGSGNIQDGGTRFSAGKNFIKSMRNGDCPFSGAGTCGQR
ncbi:hypothetical protein PoB_002140900 [Plakobranchus ocellatus]|uniref:Uncharacterized protein n=1 Tax=Plakobranchus ocellatus TaxID=259542 RepID=A0AAV3ZHV3_9GAST|nr:hypothetical protein PoB_002140900 [Plakobranchus ocellatus]